VKARAAGWVGLAALLCSVPVRAAPERGPDGVPTGRELVGAELFPPGAWASDRRVEGDLAALARQARAAADWLEAHPGHLANVGGPIREVGATPERVVDTLRRVAQVVEEDIAEGRPSRFADPDFVSAGFEVRRWVTDTAAAARRKVDLAPGQLRLTRYFVPEVQGCGARSSACPVALYADPGPSLRDRFTRAEVFAGAYEVGGAAAGGATPLAWLSRADAHDAMMQGTVVVRTPDGDQTFNVDVPNGRPYRPGVASEGQERLWYFRAVDGALGFGEAGDKLRLEPGAAVAGDPFNIGVGALVGLHWRDPAGAHTRLVVVADTGGAFQPNLFQLDWFAGRFPDRKALYAATSGVPDRVAADILLVK
jgi:hypothetical protein